jgi:hypothetical protein
MANGNAEFLPDNWSNDRIVTDEFLNGNMEAVLIVMGRLLLEYGDVSNERFERHVHRLCDRVSNQPIQPLGRSAAAVRGNLTPTRRQASV